MLYRICLTLLLVVICVSTTTAQTRLRGDMVSLDSIFRDKPVPVRRWMLSYNPWGILEWPSAAGLGIGYRWNRQVELWSESSFIFNGPYRTQGPVTGFKQVLQGKFFPSKKFNVFLAWEARYKSYQYRDTNSFVNDVLHDTLRGFSSYSRHYFWGGAFQIGLRTALGSGSRFQLEFTCGVGLRKYVHTWHDVPPGYKYISFYSRDLNVLELTNESEGFYLPGSIRLIYLFGKRFRP